MTVVVKAGSRYETTPGVAHALKNFAFKVRSSGPVERRWTKGDGGSETRGADISDHLERIGLEDC